MKLRCNITISIDQETATKVNELSKRLGLSVSDIVRRFVKYSLDKPEALRLGSE